MSNNLDNLSPRTTFKIGLFSGLGVMFAVGFFIMLALFLKGGDIGAKDNKLVANNNAGTITQPTAGGKINVQPVTKDDWVKGDRKAGISIVEFSDTECPFCKRFHSTMQQLIDEYDGKVNWIYRHFPLAQLHSKAVREAEATECAGDLAGNDGFWAYIDRMFEITPANNGLQESQLPAIAEYIGLDVGKFQSCLDSGKYADKVQDQVKQAAAAGGRGTPYSVIIAGDQTIPVNGALPIEQIRGMLDSLLK